MRKGNAIALFIVTLAITAVAGFEDRGHDRAEGFPAIRNDREENP
jgi:hypothetical protein